MMQLIDQLNDPEIHFPGNFCTPKQANALLMCLCQEAAEAIKAQAAEIAELDALRNDAVLRLDKYKALCDQMGNALHFSHEETKGWYEEITGEDYNSPIINEALEAWRALK